LTIRDGPDNEARCIERNLPASVTRFGIGSDPRIGVNVRVWGRARFGDHCRATQASRKRLPEFLSGKPWDCLFVVVFLVTKWLENQWSA
jgi:hypothetical protein